MTAFALLSPGAQTAIWALLFSCMAACVGLLVYKIANSAPARSLRGWCVLLAAASLLLAGVMPRQMPTGESVCPCRWPWAAPVLCGALLAALLAAGFADTFRTLHPEEITYSWWSYRFHAREKNAGWRIDYFIVSRRLLPRVTEAAIRTEVYGSDHCPVVLEIS